MSAAKRSTKRRKPSRSSARKKQPSRQCEFPSPNSPDRCGNTVAGDKWEAQGHRCSIHIGKGMVDAGSSSNPFVDASVVFPDLLESQYSAVTSVRDRSPMAVRTASAARLMAQTSAEVERSDDEDEVAFLELGITNARAVMETYNKWANGADMSVPANARQRYQSGAQLYYELLTKHPKLKNVTAIHLLRAHDLTIRPRPEPRGRSRSKGRGEPDLFKEQRFPDRHHDVVCMMVARSGHDQRRAAFFVDPLMPAIAPVSDAQRSVKENPQLRSTPFTETPWVAGHEDYASMERNGSLGWGRFERIATRKSRRARNTR